MHIAANIEVLYPVAQICYRRVGRVVGTKNLDCLFYTVRSVDILNYTLC